MEPIILFSLSDEALTELDNLYWIARDLRIRNLAQMILFSAEKQMVPSEIAAIVRRDQQTIRRWPNAIGPSDTVGASLFGQSRNACPTGV